MRLVMVALRILSVALLTATVIAQTVDWRQLPVNAKWYASSPHGSWPSAEEWDISRGGHLVTISSPAEDDSIRSTYLQQEQVMWIGFTDASSEGSFPARVRVRLVVRDGSELRTPKGTRSGGAVPRAASPAPPTGSMRPPSLPRSNEKGTERPDIHASDLGRWAEMVRTDTLRRGSSA